MRLRVEASAPARIDLAGGTLDIWPLSMLVPGAVTVNLAVELRARVVVEPRADGRVVVVSADCGRRASRRLPLGERDVSGPLSVLLRLVRAYEPATGLTLTSRAEAPAGAGLGGSSALGIAAGAALGRFTGRRLRRDALLRRVMNLETEELRVPTGNQDYLAALNGGLSAYRHGRDGTERERLPVPPGLAGRLVLAYTGRPRRSGYSNWEMFRRYVDGHAATVRRMNEIARIAREMRAALRADDLEGAGALLGEEGKLRGGLAPTVLTPEIRKVSRAARRAGALGVKVCGAGGGGCLAAIAARGCTADVALAMARAGAEVLPVRIARSGLIVRSRARTP